MSTAQFKVQLNGQTVIENEFKNELLTLANSASKSAMYASQDIKVENVEQLYEIQIVYAERLGGTKLKLLWESDSQQLALVSKEKLFYKLNSADTPYQFVVQPTITSPSNTHLVDIAPLNQALVNVEETARINARDQFGNLKID